MRGHIYQYVTSSISKVRERKKREREREEGMEVQVQLSTTTLTGLSDQENKELQSSFIRDEDERPKVAYNQFSNEIPIISLKDLDHGGRNDICKKIGEACEEWGIFQVIDHGVDLNLISEMTKLSSEFFALSPDEKLRFYMSPDHKGGFLVSSHLQVLYIYIVVVPCHCPKKLSNSL